MLRFIWLATFAARTWHALVVGCRLPLGAFGASLASSIDKIYGKDEGGCTAPFGSETPK
ncbi:hypothetical protein L7F22_043308, partial [Adiantum nelumboides]|nr:hypothetical protein [Adiantum nelumboides]